MITLQQVQDNEYNRKFERDRDPRYIDSNRHEELMQVLLGIHEELVKQNASLMYEPDEEASDEVETD